MMAFNYEMADVWLKYGCVRDLNSGKGPEDLLLEKKLRRQRQKKVEPYYESEVKPVF